MSSERLLAAVWLAGGIAACGSSTSPPATVTIPGAAGAAADAEATDAGSTTVTESGPSPIPEASSPGDATLASCRGNNVAGINVDERELAGYPSYAVEDCTLVYVARAIEAGARGDLRVRDLTRGEEKAIASSDEAPRRPSIAGNVIAWEATIAGVAVVRVSYRGNVRTITGPFDHAGEPRAAADGVVFTAWTTQNPLGDTDVELFLPDSGELVPVLSGPNQQRFADISATRIAFSDFSEDPDGRYDGDNNDLADIVVYDRATHQTTKRPLPGKQAFPMLLPQDQVAYLNWDWVEVHPEPKLAAYRLRVGSLAAPAGTVDREIAHVTTQTPPYVRPAAHQGTLEWVAAPNGKSQFWRAAADGSSPPFIVQGVTGVAFYAPSPTKSFTVLATRASFELPTELAAVPR